MLDCIVRDDSSGPGHVRVFSICAEFVERRNGWLALLTGLAAIVGGVAATAGAADRALAWAAACYKGERGIAA